MIFANKLLALRKSSGWSQEELAEKLNVTRQSVSKWEGASAIPDIGKIVELSKLFGVTTDYLLKDELEDAVYSGTDAADQHIRVSVREAGEFLRNTAAHGKRTAFGVMLCILSPVLLILLSGLAGAGFGPSEEAAAGIGIVTLLIMVAGAVPLFIIGGVKMQPYRYLDTGDFELEYGVEGIVREKRGAYAKKYLRSIVTGVVLCILCAVPLIVAGVFAAPEMVTISLTALLLIIVSVAVYLFVVAGTAKGGFDRLLLEGEFAPELVERNRRDSWFGGIYWPVIVAAYLAWSFLTNNWVITWLIWPIAALVFIAISAALRASDGKW